jgi:diguanylate cyclase (GGDEF)-like protein
MRGMLGKRGSVKPPIAKNTKQPTRCREFLRAILRASILTFIICSLGGFLASSFIFRTSLNKIKLSHQDHLKFAGKIIAKGVDLGKVSKVKDAGDVDTASYKSLLKSLRASLNSDPRITYIYIVRLVDNKPRFVVDGGPDVVVVNGKKVFAAKPNEVYKEASPNLIKSLKSGQPIQDTTPYKDKWGEFISSYTPLVKGKRVIAAVCVDMKYAYFERDIASITAAFHSGLFATTGFALILALLAGFFRWRIGLRNEQLNEEFKSTSTKLNKTEEDLADAMRVTKEANQSLVQTLWSSGCLIWNGTASVTDDGSLVWVGQVKYEPPFKWLAYELNAGRSFDEVWQQLRATEDQDTWRRMVTHAIKNKLEGTLIDYQINLESGQTLFFSEQLTFEYPEAGGANISAFVADITEQRTKDEQVRKLAYYDTVTGLINRTKIHEYINELLREKPRLTVIGIEISNFRNVNESWGPEIGDRLLQDVGNLLREGVAHYGVVGRLAGDDFVVIVPEEASVAWLVSKIDEACQIPSIIDGVEVAKVCRMGYVTADDGETAVGIIRKVNLALEIARKNMANYPVPYKPEMSFKAKMRVELETAMRQALTDREFHLMFQPIYCNKTRKMVKAEALLRWNSSRFGLVSPGTFIPIAEESDFINALGNYVIDETAKAISKLNQALGEELITISMNLSLRQLKNQSTLKLFSSAIERWNISPKSMLIEITESSIMHDANEGTAMLDVLQDRGFSLAIDDFGTGYSSLSTLASLPFNCLKIDKKFVDGIGVDRKQETVLATIVRLARALNLQIVAEGIEQEAQFDFLRELDVEFSQGYYFAKPLPFEDVMEIAIQSHRKEAA